MKNAVLKVILGVCMSAVLLSGCGKSGETKQNAVETGQEVQQEAESTEDVSESLEEEQEEVKGQEEEVKDTTEGQEIYTYKDMSVTIPASWEGKYIVQEWENGFSFLQKASNEKEEDWGFLFGFYRSDEMVDETTGAEQLAYTDEYAYYVQSPTDVTFWYEDESIAAEYAEMEREKEAVKNSLVISGENVRYDAREYVLPMSQTKEIPEYYLENMSSNQLWIARNEIYARHGRIFDSSYLSNYFASCSWYQGTVGGGDFDESVFSQIEKENLEKIKAQEEKVAAAKSYPQSCQFGKTYNYDLDGDGKEEELCITYKENEEHSVYDVTLNLEGYLIIPDTVYDLSRDDVYYFNINTDEFFVTDISPFFPGLEIAVMDYGMSDDLVTHFYTYDGEFRYIGTVGGFPFKKYMELDGFAWEGCVQGITRVDLINTCFAYNNWFYDYEEKTLKPTEGQMLTMVPSTDYRLKEDLEVRTAQDPDAPTRIMKAQDIFFMETDGLEWIKIKGKDGSEGYLYIIDGKIEGTQIVPQDVIDGLHFAG